jgi:hypothetical protein
VADSIDRTTDSVDAGDGVVDDERAHKPIDADVLKYLAANCDRGHFGEQDENGVDMSLIRGNLKLTPAERLRRGDRFTTDLLRLSVHAERPFRL